ncbi:hypothetical protein RHSIM_Rhsim09G0185800 [Rhododendron simsii]|uniref:DUF7804 domain-containing protein n=1 Tax=Rhododendron simsii TaxID=118357 RepID=A0A834LFZ5_RHOSS|nr:hypothetical protein RHSIM_Rhsim09G0185800 [Rhododendron simsii]
MASVSSVPYEVNSCFAAFNLSSSRRMAPCCSINPRSGSDADSSPHRIATVRSHSSRKRLPRISAAATASNSSVLAPRSGNEGGVLFSETLDEWMRDSTAEIVRNLRRAPLLVQIYASGDGSAGKVETEKAVADEWPAVTRRWKDGVAAPPDGVILVEELAGDGGEEDGTRAWGMVVQGKGAECGPACYLMKTSRVGSGMGLGCTHFCLMKVEGFRESAPSQLKNCWLLR